MSNAAHDFFVLCRQNEDLRPFLQTLHETASEFYQISSERGECESSGKIFPEDRMKHYEECRVAYEDVLEEFRVLATQTGLEMPDEVGVSEVCKMFR